MDLRTGKSAAPGPGAALARVLRTLRSLDLAELAAIGPDLLEEAVALDRSALLGGLTWEVDPAQEVHDQIADRAGFTLSRELLRLERDLPVRDSDPGGPSAPARPPGPPPELRAFRPGEDELSFLELNDRAFGWHPEQAQWMLPDVLAREAETWFDPEGFLLAEDDGVLVGFCWTKVHQEEQPPAGEIYVVGVDPQSQGRGLGSALVRAGLAHLAERGLGRALLWVEADNTAARALYARLGFSTTARHCWYRARPDPGGAAGGGDQTSPTPTRLPTP